MVGQGIKETVMPLPRTNLLGAGHWPSDMDLVHRALEGDGEAVRAIMQMHNRRLYRIARAIAGNDSEAEDIVQEGYVTAFARLGSFRGESALATWLSRIVINEALGRLRRRRRAARFAASDDGHANTKIIPFPLGASSDDPERRMAQRQILQLVELAVDDLPGAYRTVFIARLIEGMSIEETAELLGVRPETVKTRLHRARRLVRKKLDDQIGPVLLDAFPFAGRRCERLTAGVMKRLGFFD
jgi:RNA polymerase sigma-70 factor (ECF subfamily)